MALQANATAPPPLPVFLIVRPILMAEALLKFVDAEHWLDLVGRAEPGTVQCSQLLERTGRAVVLLDGVADEEIPIMRSLAPEARFVTLGRPRAVDDGKRTAEMDHLRKLGVVACIPWEVSRERLVTILTAVSADLTSFPAPRREHRNDDDDDADAPLREAVQSLTPRELEVLLLMAAGATNKGIAKDLGIRTSTAKNHVHNILNKLGVPTRAAATALWYRYGTDIDLDRLV